MNRFLERPVIAVTLLGILCSYLFFVQLGAVALTDPDESFYAQTAKEMLNKNEWSTHYLYDKPQFEKPILFYWLVELSYRVFGVNEFAARFPSAFLALLGIIAIYFLGSILFNRRVGIFSAIVMATNVEYILLARACVTDMALATFMLLGILFFFYGHTGGRRYFYLLSAASFALATLTKGPIAIILAGAALFIYLFLTKNLIAFKKIPIMGAVCVFCAIALPWFLLMYRLHGRSFMDAFFGFHNVTRFLVSEHKIGSQVYYNIPIVFGGFFPWSAFLPFGFWHMFKKVHSPWSIVHGPESRKQNSSCIFLLTWFFVIFGFFSVSSTKLPTYIFPCFVSLALIVAVLWDDFLDGAVIKGLKASYYFLLVVIILGTIGALAYIKIDYPVILKGASASTVFLIFGFMLSFMTFLSRRYLMTFLFIAYSVVIFLYPLNKFVLPKIERYETSKETSKELLSLMKPGEALGSESNYMPGLAFYTGKFPVNLDSHHMMTDFLGSKERVWCVMKEKNHRELYELDSIPRFTRPSYMIYKVGKRAIVTNIIPDDGVYLIKRERNK